MKSVINVLSAQATELLKNDYIQAMLRDCASDEERCQKLLIASMHALSKVN